MEGCRSLTPEEIRIFLPLMVLGIAILFSPFLYLGYHWLIKSDNSLAFMRGLNEKSISFAWDGTAKRITRQVS